MNFPFARVAARGVAQREPSAAALQVPVAAGLSTTRAGSYVLRIYPALGVSAFRMLWLGLLPATMAFQMGVVVRPYVAFALTGTAATIGFVSLANGLPMLLLCLVGGVAADRLSRHRVLLWTHVVFLVSAIIPAILLFTGRLEVWHLLVASLFQGAAMPFNMPARQAYIADTTGRAMLPNAVALNNAGANFGRLVGPAVAGGLLAVPDIGIGLTFLAMALMYLYALWTLLRLPTDRVAAARPRVQTTRPTGVSQLMEGLRYTASSPVILVLLAMASAMSILGMQYQTLMTLFAERVFQVGAGGLGLLMAMAGLGALSGAVTVAASTRFDRPAVLQLGLGIAFSVALIGFAVMPSFQLALATLSVVGFCSSAFMGLNMTLITSNSPPHLYGRMMSIYMLTFAAQPLGAVPLAWLADVAGAPASLVVAGALVLAIVAGIAILYPPYRRISWTRQ